MNGGEKKEGRPKSSTVRADESNTSDLGLYLYGLNMSSLKKPKGKYIPNKKSMPGATLAFPFKKFQNDEKKTSERQKEEIDTAESSSSIADFCPTQKISDKSKVESTPLPLAASCRWYTKQGELSKAKVRTAVRRSAQTGEFSVNNETFAFVSTSRTTESLSESITRLEGTISAANSTERARLSGIQDVARCLRDTFPLLKTQKICTKGTYWV